MVLDQIADRVVVLDAGRCRLAGTPAQMTRTRLPVLRVAVEQPHELAVLAERMAGKGWDVLATGGGLEVRGTASGADVHRAAAEAGVCLMALSLWQPGLEQAVLDVLGEPLAVTS